MPLGLKAKAKMRLSEAADVAALAVASGVQGAADIVRDDNKRERIALHALSSAEKVKEKARDILKKKAEGDEESSSDGVGESDVPGNIDRIPKTEVGRRLEGWGYRPRRPVALFNSLSGCQLQVESSNHKPRWAGDVLWVEPSKLGLSAASNFVSQASPKKYAKKDRRWRENLFLIMDEDGDGEVDPEEIAAFCEGSEELKDDPVVEAALKNREGKTSAQLLKDLRVVRSKLSAALLEEREVHGELFIQTEENRTSKHDWTRHMQLVDGWRDPEGIRVRQKPGLEAMESLLANDSSGLATKVGAGLLIGLTSQLATVGFQEGKNLLACGYDWRTPCTKLEERDGRFTALMDDLEDLVAANRGEAAVVVTHSLGGVCAHYFFHWVAQSDIGRKRGGHSWLKRHIYSFIPIGGPMLGTPYGSHAYLCGDEGQGIAPLLVSYANRHLLIRSWGMFPMIFPSGRHLMLQPARSPHWIRREAVLRIHILSVKVPDDHPSLATAIKKDGRKRKCYLHLSLQPPKTKYTHRLRTSSRELRTDAAYDEQFQFAWSTTVESAEGCLLTLSLCRLREAGIKSILSGVVDEPVDTKTFCLGGSESVDLPPHEWSDDQRLILDGGIQVSVRLQFIPHGKVVGTKGSSDFTRAAVGDMGAWRCGGPADASTSGVKQNRLVETLGAELGHEYFPAATKSRMAKQDAAKHGSATYEPARVDQLMVMDGMEHEYNVWQKCYADDPVWKARSTEAPPVRRVFPIYGINVPTLIGSVFRHRTKRYERAEPATSLKLDKYCDVEHPGYSVEGGVVSEVPHATPQADDPIASPEEMTYRTRASGDGTVAYWSLRWPIAWRKDGIDVEDPLEVEGAGHRNILEEPQCIAAVLGECCYHPAMYIELSFAGIKAPAHDSNEQLILRMDWRGIQQATETIRTNNETGSSLQFTEPNLVLGITEEDIDKDRSLELEPLTSLDDILESNVTPAIISVRMLVSGNAPKQIKFKGKEGGKDEMTLSWSIECYPAARNGQPRQ